MFSASAAVMAAVVVVCGLFLVLFVVMVSGTIVYVPNRKAGVVERWWSLRGSVKNGLIALEGEAGYQPEVLRGGWHLFVPFTTRVHIIPLVTVPQGRLGYVFARDGAPLGPDETLALDTGALLDDVRDFLARGGRRGPQRKILREGTHAINLAQFIVLTEDRSYFLPLEPGDGERFQKMADQIKERAGFRPVTIDGAKDVVGIVTIHDGPPLLPGEIIAPSVPDHADFQDPERFLKAGGRRGRQLQVLTEGTWYINRLFATVEVVPKTIIDVGHVGVVVSYTGQRGADVSGDTYSHGELVAQGERGVWSTALLPGKYAFNVYAGKVISVPTTNFILKWIRAEAGSHGFDENLAEVRLITKDAFEPSLPLSVVVHIDYRKAPLVVQRFGDIQRLVEQTLDPMVSAYFKNVGQTRTLIQLLQDRASIQDHASSEMRAKFERYNLDLEEVLIGTPSANGNGDIDQILAQLRARQIADERVETYKREEAAAFHQRSLKEAQARADQQTRITASELEVTVQTNVGRAQYERSVQEANEVRVRAEAEAERAARVGIANALATEEQVRAYGGPQYQVIARSVDRFAEAIEEARVDVVPKIVVGGNGGGNLLEALLATVLNDKLGSLTSATPQAPSRPEAEAIKASLRAKIAAEAK
jgi:uncharacterized membrane protein YqiK